MPTLKIFCAGSIRKALERLAESFSLSSPDVSFLFTAGGSVELARDLLSGKEWGDLFFSADHSLLSRWFLDPERVTLVEPLVANSKVLAFPRESAYRGRLAEDDWFRLLQEPGVALGHSAPDNDPGGYRTIMVLQLAEIFYGEPGLFDRVWGNPSRFVLPPLTTHAMVDRFHDEGLIDFMIRYRSSIQGERYGFVELPREINLGDPAMAEFYARACAEIRGRNGKPMKIPGEPILYGVALLADSPFPEEARVFLDHAFSVEGGRIFREYGFDVLNRA